MVVVIKMKDGRKEVFDNLYKLGLFLCTEYSGIVMMNVYDNPIVALREEYKNTSGTMVGLINSTSIDLDLEDISALLCWAGEGDRLDEFCDDDDDEDPSENDAESIDRLERTKNAIISNFDASLPIDENAFCTSKDPELLFTAKEHGDFYYICSFGRYDIVRNNGKCKMILDKLIQNFKQANKDANVENNEEPKCAMDMNPFELHQFINDMNNKMSVMNNDARTGCYKDAGDKIKIAEHNLLNALDHAVGYSNMFDISNIELMKDNDTRLYKTVIDNRALTFIGTIYLDYVVCECKYPLSGLSEVKYKVIPAHLVIEYFDIIKECNINDFNEENMLMKSDLYQFNIAKNNLCYAIKEAKKYKDLNALLKDINRCEECIESKVDRRFMIGYDLVNEIYRLNNDKSIISVYGVSDHSYKVIETRYINDYLDAVYGTRLNMEVKKEDGGSN